MIAGVSLTLLACSGLREYGLKGFILKNDFHSIFFFISILHHQPSGNAEIYMVKNKSCLVSDIHMFTPYFGKLVLFVFSVYKLGRYY